MARRGRPKATRLGARTASQDNNFDLLRLGAAALVLVAHSYDLTGHRQPFHQQLPEYGYVAVSTFFAISGFLVTRSWSLSPRALSFCAKRALRILPGLWVCLLATTLVVGIAVTSWSASEYLGATGTWRYLSHKALVFSSQDALPGVFGGGSVNGSLWTLPIELTAYAALLALGIVGLLRSPLTAAALLAGLAVLELSAPDHLDDVLFAVPLFWLVVFGLAFAAGMLLYLSRDRIVLLWPLGLGALVLWRLGLHTRLTFVIGAIAIAYVAVWLAYLPGHRLRALTRYGDVSYGLYIYGFPVQMTILHIWPGIGPLVLLALSAPTTWFLALGSWRLVERPALTLKRRLPRRHPVPALAPEPSAQ